jgi:DHA1 family multidrug resistance protein-like MFS transporter
LLTGLFVAPNFWAHTMTQLILLRIAVGLAAGGMMPAMNALVAHVVPRSNIGQAYGFTAMASAWGWALGPALGGAVATALGYRWPFIIMAVLIMLVAITQQRWLTVTQRGESVHDTTVDE